MSGWWETVLAAGPSASYKKWLNCCNGSKKQLRVVIHYYIGSQYISPDPAFVGTGSEVTLTCQHPSRPSAKVRWARGGLGSSLSALDDQRLTVTGSQLLISQFHGSELAGQYSCTVEPLEEGEAQTVVSCPAEVKHARKLKYSEFISSRKWTQSSQSS